MSQLPIAEWWLMALLHGALQLHPCDIEIAQSPGDAHHGSSIPAVMQHLAPGAAGEVGAGFQAQLPIESFSTTEKTDAGLLHQVIQIIETLTLQSRGHKTCQSQMLQGQVIALSNRGRHRALPLVSQR